MKDVPNHHYDIIYTDVPYNMGSKYYIDRSNGHYRFKGKGSDFMAKWKAFDGLWWDKWFKEAFRILKIGGFLVTHNIDRQSDMWTYYGRRNGFFPMQKLYWLFLNNFPKGVDVAQQLDKTLGVKQEISGKAKGKVSANVYHDYSSSSDGSGTYDKGIATSDLAKKYDGYKFGQAPLKQILEEIIVLQRPYEDNSSTAKIIIKAEEEKKMSRPSRYHPSILNLKLTSVKGSNLSAPTKWTPQLIIQDEIRNELPETVGHIDGANMIDQLVKIKYDDLDYPYKFCRKATKAEKDEGLDGLEEVMNNKASLGSLVNENGKDKWASKLKNFHPTPKPLKLCQWIVDLFALPDKEDMRLYDPFCGQGSILVASELAGIKWNGTEINPDFADLAERKIKYHTNKKNNSLNLFGEIR